MNVSSANGTSQDLVECCICLEEMKKKLFNPLHATIVPGGISKYA